MGIHGHGQLMPRLLKAGPTKFRRRSEPRSSLYVIVRLTRAAKGNGSVREEHPAAKKVLISIMLNQPTVFYVSIVGKKILNSDAWGAIFGRTRELQGFPESMLVIPTKSAFIIPLLYVIIKNAFRIYLWNKA